MQILIFEHFQLLKSYSSSKSNVIKTECQNWHTVKLSFLIGKIQANKTISGITKG